MIKIRWTTVVLIVLILVFLPLDRIRALRRRLADFVMYQWRRMSVLSAVVYALLIKNGHNPDDIIEDLEKYLGDD